MLGMKSTITFPVLKEMYRFQQGKWMLLTVSFPVLNFMCLMIDRGKKKKTKNEHWLKRQSSKAWIIFQKKQ